MSDRLDEEQGDSFRRAIMDAIDSDEKGYHIPSKIKTMRVDLETLRAENERLRLKLAAVPADTPNLITEQSNGGPTNVYQGVDAWEKFKNSKPDYTIGNADCVHTLKVKVAPTPEPDDVDWALIEDYAKGKFSMMASNEFAKAVLSLRRERGEIVPPCDDCELKGCELVGMKHTDPCDICVHGALKRKSKSNERGE